MCRTGKRCALPATATDGSSQVGNGVSNALSSVVAAHSASGCRAGAAAANAGSCWHAASMAIACEIHPLNNLRVLGYLSKTLGVSDEQKNAWYRHWVETGLATVEAMLAGDPRTGAFCHGDAPTLADIFLVPQIFNAQRFACRLDHVPTVMRIHERCLALPAFAAAVPAGQPDAE